MRYLTLCIIAIALIATVYSNRISFDEDNEENAPLKETITELAQKVIDTFKSKSHSHFWKKVIKPKSKIDELIEGIKKVFEQFKDKTSGSTWRNSDESNDVVGTIIDLVEKLLSQFKSSKQKDIIDLCKNVPNKTVCYLIEISRQTLDSFKSKNEIEDNEDYD